MSNDHREEVSGENRTDALLPLETVFQTLRNQRRRSILYHLTTSKHPVPFEELVEIITVEEAETDREDIPVKVYEQVALDLHHKQLPKLDQWGIIEYNTEVELITVAETLRPLDEFLRLAKQHDQQSETQDRS